MTRRASITMIHPAPVKMTRKLPLLFIAAACTGTMKPNQTPVPGGPAVPSRDNTPIVWPDEGLRYWAPRPTEAAITANDLRTRLYQIANDSMQGRRIGEPGNYRVTTYIASEFQRLGLKPAGENGTYFQTLPYGTLVFALAKSKLSVGTTVLEPKTDWVPAAPTGTNGVDDSATLVNAPTVFAGRWGDTATTLEASMVRGKVVVFTAPRSSAGGRGGGRGGRGGGPGNFAAVNDARARRAGAVGALVISLDSMSANARNGAFNARQGMKPTPTDDAVPAAAISAAAAEKIFGRPASQLEIGTAGQPISASWSSDFTISPTPARNVIAILPGSDPARAREYVLLSAHNDHNGVSSQAVDHDSLRAFNKVMRPQGANDRPGTPTAEQRRRIDSLIAYARSIRPPRRDSINNGADDDGSGTVVLLEVAEQFASEHPARSIIFISHQGEEGGLLGSRWFTDHPTIPLDSIAAAHNMDMVGKGRVTDVKFGGPASVQTLGSRRLSREFGDIIDSVNAIIPQPMAIDRSWDVPANPLNRFCRSDQVNYVRHNVPVTYFSTGYSADYHQLTDEPQYVDYDHSARLGRFIHAIMTAIADRKDRPAISGPDPSYPKC
jgi:Zn-dependent M28 family amino/carboxypeptidase